MKKIVLTFMFIIIFSAVCMGSEQYTIIRAKAGLRLRTEPSLSGKKILTIPSYSPVKILETVKNTVVINGRKGNWCKISYYEGITQKEITGYSFNSYFMNMKKMKNTYDGHIARMIIKEDKLARKHRLYLKRDYPGSRIVTVRLKNEKLKKYGGQGISCWLQNYDTENGYYVFYAIEGGEAHFLVLMDDQNGRIYPVGDEPHCFNKTDQGCSVFIKACMALQQKYVFTQ